MTASMQKLRDKIGMYNILNSKVISEKYPNYIDFNKLLEKEKIDSKGLTLIENIVGMSLPKELKKFYTLFGGLETKDNTESNSFMIFSVAELVQKLQEDNKWYKLNSLGILDMVLFSWGHDRPEIKQHLTTEQIQLLNENYKSYGWYRDSWITESFCYLYFDKSNNFGKIYYHQDYFNNFQIELEKLINGQIEPKNLENLLCEIIDETINDPEGIISGE